ncbi:MAG: leucine-rich repeat protein, partial [Prevotella sp.]|nr:leucine-rich repeat protein [Prevotella sp.]
MKTSFKTIASRLAFVAGLLALTCSEARADDYSRYGIRYDFISDTEAEVSGTDDREAYDLYWLADDISVNGKTYRVVGIRDGVFRGKTVSGWKSSAQMKYIGADAFRDAKLKWEMSGTELPYLRLQVGEIGAGAFAGFAVADRGWLDIRLSADVERIGAMAFASDAINSIDCTELDDADKMPTTDGELCEERHYSQIEIRCNDWTEKWQTADTWKKFHAFYYYANHQRDEQGMDYVLDNDSRTASLRSGFSYHARSVTAEEVFSIGQTFTFRYDYAVTAIGSYALGSSTMTSLQLPTTIREIGEGAFVHCPKLTEVAVLASEPPAMPEQAFTADVLATATLRVPEASLQEYRQADGWKLFAHIAATDKAIAANAVFRDETASTRLAYIERLKDDYQLPREAAFPLRVTVDGEEKMVLGLDDGVCDKQTELERVSFPFGYLQIGTFKKCTALKSVNVPSTVQELGWGAFEGCTALTDVTLQRGVMRLQNRAFYGCQSLERITPPSTIERICDRAFQGTSLT